MNPMRVMIAALAAGLAATAVAAPKAKKPAAKPARAAVASKKAPAKPPVPVKPAEPAKPPRPMAFTPAELDLAPGESFPVELFVPSPTGKAVQGSLSFTPGAGISVTPDKRWTGRVPPWGAKTFPRVTASADAEGDQPVTATLDRGGEAALTVRVTPPLLEIVPGHRQLTVRVTSPFHHRPLTGRIEAANPDRFLQDVTALEFNVAPGKTQELVFPLPGAAPAEGESYNFTLTVETYQGFRMKKTYPLMFPPHS
ncbi:MAG TPA: hypothetical protein VK689_15770 [Armatimonadota bacterium]|nr:hypothetical protein [Armatimonadota bacterium]